MKTMDKLLTTILAATLVFSVLSVANPMYLVIGPAAYADNNEDKSDRNNADDSDKRGHDDEECIPENDDEDETEQETSQEDESDDADDEDIEDSDDEDSDDSDNVDDEEVEEEEVEDDDTNEQDNESEDDDNEVEDDEEVDEGSDDSVEDSDESEESEEQVDDDNANEEADEQDDDADEQEREDECENESGHDDGQQEQPVSEEEIKEKHKERLHKIVNSVTGTQIHERHLKAEPNSPGDYAPGQAYSLVAAGMAEHDGTSHSFDVDMDVAVWKSNAAIVLMDVIGGNVTIEGQTYTIAVGYGIYSINHDMLRVTALVVDDATGEVFKLKLRGAAFGEDASLPATAGESVELTFSGNSGPSKNDFDGAELDLYGALTAS